jgi:hypothetical protein
MVLATRNAEEDALRLRAATTDGLFAWADADGRITPLPAILDRGEWIDLPDGCRGRYSLLNDPSGAVSVYLQLTPWRDQRDRSRPLRRAIERHRREYAKRLDVKLDSAILVLGKVT